MKKNTPESDIYVFEWDIFGPKRTFKNIVKYWVSVDFYHRALHMNIRVYIHLTNLPQCPITRANQSYYSNQCWMRSSSSYDRLFFLCFIACVALRFVFVWIVRSIVCSKGTNLMLRSCIAVELFLCKHLLTWWTIEAITKEKQRRIQNNRRRSKKKTIRLCVCVCVLILFNDHSVLFFSSSFTLVLGSVRFGSRLFVCCCCYYYYCSYVFDSPKINVINFFFASFRECSLFLANSTYAYTFDIQ